MTFVITLLAVFAIGTGFGAFMVKTIQSGKFRVEQKAMLENTETHLLAAELDKRGYKRELYR